MALFLISLIIGIPWLGAFIIWLIGDRNERLQHSLAILFSALAGIASILLLFSPSSQPVISLPIGGAFGDFTFNADGLGVFLSVVATVIGCLAVIFSADYMKNEAQLSRYYAFILFFIGSMAGLVLTTNLLLIFVFWEMTALCSYALIAFHNDDPKAVAGGIKALIITQIGGIGLMAGALFIYAATGSFDINQFIAAAPSIPSGVLSVAAFGFLIAAAAKSAQFPFQPWLPDAMEAPTPISALIHAATMVNAGVYLLIRFYPAFEAVPGWKTAVVVVGLLSALLAALMAIFATDLKRVLAYSTVSQLGYMVYAIGAGGLFASSLHLMSHSVFKALLFLAAGAVIHGTGTRDMRKMGNLSKQIPVIRNVFIIGALSLAGLPILNGFWSKELILEAGLVHGPLWAYIIMLIVAGLTAFYTFRCVWMVFFANPSSELHGHEAGSAMKIALYLLAIGTLSTWLLAGPFSRLLESTMAAHHFHDGATMDFVMEVLAAPATYLALVVVGLGLLAWWLRSKLKGVQNSFKWLGWSAEHSFGFEAINRGIVTLTKDAAELLRNTQTGYLPWNIFGIIASLIIIIGIVAIGAG